MSIFFRHLNSAHTEDPACIDNADTAKLNKMPNVLRSLTDKGLGRNAPDLHSVIRNQTMTAFDELDSCFALFSNAAVAEKQDSFTVYLNQHAVPCNTGSQPTFMKETNAATRLEVVSAVLSSGTLFACTASSISESV